MATCQHRRSPPSPQLMRSGWSKLPLVRESSSAISEDGSDRLGKALEWTLWLKDLSATTTKRSHGKAARAGSCRQARALSWSSSRPRPSAARPWLATWLDDVEEDDKQTWQQEVHPATATTYLQWWHLMKGDRLRPMRRRLEVPTGRHRRRAGRCRRTCCRRGPRRRHRVNRHPARSR